MWKRLMLTSAMTVGWPLVTLMDSLKMAADQARSGQGRFLHSFRDLYGNALMRNVPPSQNARYRSLWAGEKFDLSEFLMPLDLRGLNHLNQRRGAVPNEVQDKARFEEICRSHGLPCIETLAAFHRHGSTGEDRLRVHAGPIFVKALSGNKGVGAELWIREAEGWTSNSGEFLGTDELIAALRSRTCIVQPALEDCAELRALGTVALSSVRIVTARGLSIPATPIAASISLATELAALTGHHGVQCAVDVHSGRIVAVDPETRSEEERPPEDRKTDLLAFTVPHWMEMVVLACRAHDEAFPAFATLGWDLALTPAGPVLIETNVGWGMTQHQKLSGPLGATALAGVIDELL